ncbi:MAG: transcription antitermination factor NusB [Treponema sp.]|nr:transcription antitermination factor NusB [Treponema sp.]
MASRRKGRILAFQALYSWDVHYSQTGDASIPEGLLDFPWTLKDGDTSTTMTVSEEVAVFSRLLVSGTVENITSIDNMIQKHLKNWDITRLNRVDLAVLRMSAYTLMFQTDMPPNIVIDEAIDISKEFGADDSYRFVNGVLDGILKTISPSPQGG